MKRIILHCSDSNYGNAAEITVWHLARKFKTIGYHYVILNGWTAHGYFDRDFDGIVESGRNPEIEGAHCEGQNHAIGICLIGKSKLYTDKQIQSAKDLIIKLKNQYGGVEIFQHSDFNKNKYFCAGLDLTEFRRLI